MSDPLEDYNSWATEYGTPDEEGGHPTFKSITAEHNASNPLKVDDYEPHFPRESHTRRVLGTITDEEDAQAGGVPRNTRDAVARVMVPDETSPKITEQAHVDAEFDALAEAGLIEQRDDGSYGLTRAGWVELSN
jgi:hypothetical protein